MHKSLFAKHSIHRPKNMKSVRRVAILIAVAAVITIGLLYAFPVGVGRVRVKVSTTTSLYVSGLLEFIAEEFRKRYPNTELVFIAVGSGAALESAKRGDACAVLVHSPSLEKRYADAIRNHRIFAYNVFVVVGPSDDPANVSKTKSVLHAFERIYMLAKSGGALFVSRGDGSGTHAREVSIWRLINASISNSWYIECGCGSDQALIIANEFRAYTLTDVVTYTLLEKRGRVPNIKALYVNYSDPLAINIYSAYVSSNCNDPDGRMYAEAFVDFLYQNQWLIEKFNDVLGFEGFRPARSDEHLLRRVWESLSEVEASG